MRTIDLNIECDRIAGFIREQLQSAGLSQIVIGLSGGVDSAVACALAVRAIGATNVHGVMLPYRTSAQESYDDALAVAEYLGIAHEKVEITPMVDAYFTTYATDATPLRRGNRMARERMCVLFDLSAKYGALVEGTGNKSELWVGYVTQHGDGACAFEPIGHLYKTEVWEMARLLGLPKAVIEKKPTADLWDGQTDENEMGIAYLGLDEILWRLIDRKMPREQVITDGFSAQDVDKVLGMIARSAFKRCLPPQPEWLG
jgi:NAD+ synthase